VADLLDRLHFDAALTLLRADAGPPALVVYPDPEGLTPTIPADQYVRVYCHIDRPPDTNSNSLAGISQTLTTRWICHCVGLNEYASLATAMRVRAALLDQRVTIAGRNPGLIRQEQSNPPAKDDSTGRTVIDTVVVYRMTST
jgi:hypothetical protein